MAILGGDDAGGGVIWAPQVLEDAKNHGLVLSEKGKLYDTKKGESLPNNMNPMPPLTEKQLSEFPELKGDDIIANHVARYLDLLSLSKDNPAKVIGEKAKQTSLDLKLSLFLEIHFQMPLKNQIK